MVTLLCMTLRSMPIDRDLAYTKCVVYNESIRLYLYVRTTCNYGNYIVLILHFSLVNANCRLINVYPLVVISNYFALRHA